MPFDKQILCIAEDPAVRQTKHMVLEQIGFSVVSVGSLREVEYVSHRSKFDLAIIGRSFAEPVKRSIADSVRRNLPDTPILEMCNVSPVISGADHVLHSHNPEDLAEKVKLILRVQSATPRP